MIASVNVIGSIIPRRTGLGVAVALSAVLVGYPAAEPSASPATAAKTTATVRQFPAEAWQRFDDLIGDDLLRRGNRAASVSVTVDGQLVHAAAFGHRAPGDPVTTSDRFRIASISKVITATVVLQLVERGDLTLDEPVGRLLADIAGVPLLDPALAAITVRQLLSHTAGFPDYREQFFGGHFRSCHDAAAFGLTRSPVDAPGTTHHYSNLNFCLLHRLIDHVTGMSYEAAVDDLLLAPLGITGMRLVATFDPDPDEVVHDSGTARTYMEALGGAGGWVATPSDLVRILDSLHADGAGHPDGAVHPDGAGHPDGPGWHPLSAGLASLMRQPLDVDYPEPSRRMYGLGIVVWPDGSWGHTGTVENTHTMLVRRPDGTTWCILVSGDHPRSTEALGEVFDDAFAGAGLAV